MRLDSKHAFNFFRRPRCGGVLAVLKSSWRLWRAVPACAAALLFSATVNAGAASAVKPLIVGLDADMSSGAAQSGEAIRRGIILAMEEINAAGGVLGRPLELLVRDHRGNPARGIDNIEEFAEVEDLVAVVGGIHTPVALAELESIHKHELLYLGPWAAGTPIVSNGFEPNFVFRVSVRDEFAGGFLIDAALARGYQRPGLLLWRTGWGRSNEKAMKAALARLEMTPAGIEWFNSDATDMSDQLDALLDAGADVLMLVANPVDGATVMRAMAQRPPERRLPIISHWGITGGDFHHQVAEAIDSIELTFLQTFSFANPPYPDRTGPVFRRYCTRFGPCRDAASVISPVGTAHAYDLIHLLQMAIEKAQSTDRGKIRSAMETLGRFEGLMRDYDPPFTPARHDALDASDFNLSRFDNSGGIIPALTQ